MQEKCPARSASRCSGRPRALATASLWRHSNRSLFARGNSAGKRFGEARDWGGTFGEISRFRATETALSGVSSGKAAEVKGYSDGAREPHLRPTARWGW
jgi:hypothetical protein